MTVATEYGLSIDGATCEPAPGEVRDLFDLYLEAKSVVVATGTRPANPLGL